MQRNQLIHMIHPREKQPFLSVEDDFVLNIRGIQTKNKDIYSLHLKK